MKFRKKPIVIEADRWWKKGDHSKDNCMQVQIDQRDESTFLSEGEVVRYFRHPNVSGDTKCKHCSVNMHDHGWIDTLEGGNMVCPGDWIITGVKGEFYPCKPDIFEMTYEPVD